MTNPKPPDWYTPTQTAIWTDLLTQLKHAGNTTPPDPDTLDALVGHITRHRRAQQLLAQTDILTNRDGTPVPNPALPILKNEEQAITRLRRQLGLTKKQLSPIQLPPPTATRPLGRWCDSHKRYECTAHRQTDGQDCHGSLVVGQPRCKKHLGLALDNPVVVLGRERVLNPLAGEPMDITPLQALIWRVRVLAGEVARLDMVVASLDGDDVVYGITRVEETEDYSDTPTRVVTREARLNMWIELRSQRERVLHSACEAAMRAGVQEQVVDLLKQQAAVLHKVILTTLSRMGIDAADPRIPVIVPEVIREVTA